MSPVFDPEVLAKLKPEDRAALEKFERDEEFAEGEIISLNWLMSDAGCNYISNRTNAKLMADWINAHGSPKGVWSNTNLDNAMRATQRLHVERDTVEPVVEVPPTPPPPPPTDEQLYGPWRDLTKTQVIRMSGKEMRIANRDTRFISKVNSLGITQTELRQGAKD